MAEESGDNISKVIAAICYVNKTIGFSCYDELSNSILADSIPASYEDMEELLAKIKTISNPTLFLIHPTFLSNKSLLDLLVCGIDGVPDTYRHTTMKSSSWNPDAALEIMCTKLAIDVPRGRGNEGIYHNSSKNILFPLYIYSSFRFL